MQLKGLKIPLEKSPIIMEIIAHWNVRDTVARDNKPELNGSYLEFRYL